jgi:phage-related protein
VAHSILVEIFGDATQFQRSMDKATGSTRRFGAAAKVAGGLVATGLVIGLEQSVKAAINAQDSHRRLEQAFKNVGVSADKYAQQIDGAEASSRKLGFAGNETRDALGSLLTATGNVTTSIKDLAIAQDLARFKGVDLESATRLLTGAMSGSQRAIKALGIAISPVTTAVDELKRSHVDLSTAAGRAELAQAKLADKMATGQAVIAATSKLVEGQGQAYSETAAGGMARFHAELDHLEVTVGNQLLPVLTRLLEQVNELGADFNANIAPAIKRVTDLLGHLGGAATAFKILLLPLREQILLWRLEFKAVEIGIKLVEGAIKGLRVAAEAVGAWFASKWHLVMLGVHHDIDVLQDTLGLATSGLHALKTAGQFVANVFSGALSGAFRVFRAIASGVAGIVNAIAGALRGAAGAARDLASALGSIHVPSIHLPHIGMPHIPGTAMGGIVTSPQVRLVGEAGPEAIIPLGSAAMGAVRGGGGVNVTVHVHGALMGSSVGEVAATIRSELIRVQRRNGGLGFGT